VEEHTLEYTFIESFGKEEGWRNRSPTATCEGRERASVDWRKNRMRKKKKGVARPKRYSKYYTNLVGTLL
jgi:hypothetical protein